MAMTRVRPGPARRVVKKSPSLPGKGKVTISLPGLPTSPKRPEADPLRFTYLLYGREGIGKTTHYASYPDTLFLSTEPGTKGQVIYEYNSGDGGCRSWEFVRHAASLLHSDDHFRFVVIDTVDRAFDLCLDYVCAKMDIPYPGEDSEGREDYGKSWNAIKDEFMDVIHTIEHSGKGLAFISHEKEEQVRTKSGDRFTLIRPSYGKTATKVLSALVDFGFYCTYSKSADGSQRRIMFTEGDELVWGKHREVQYPIHHLPLVLPITPRNGYEILMAGFAGEKVGLDPRTLVPVKGASPVLQKFFTTAHKIEARRRKLDGVSKPRIRKEEV